MAGETPSTQDDYIHSTSRDSNRSKGKWIKISGVEVGHALDKK